MLTEMSKTKSLKNYEEVNGKLGARTTTGNVYVKSENARFELACKISKLLHLARTLDGYRVPKLRTLSFRPKQDPYV